MPERTRRAVRGAELPPVERLDVPARPLGPDGIVATVLNDGPDPVTIAQIVVDDAFWAFGRARQTLGHWDGRRSASRIRGSKEKRTWSAWSRRPALTFEHDDRSGGRHTP